MPALLSVNVGLPRERDWAGIGRTSIDKRPVAGPVDVHALGVAGDQVSDTQHHGGRDQAVSAYAREDLDFWAAELGRPVRDGQFGENLTTEGLDLNALEVGSRLRVGPPAGGPGAERAVLLEVASVRTPCNDFKCWMGESGFDDKAWVKRFARALRPGPYLRVLEPGRISAGDPVEVVHRPGHGVSVRDMFVALNLDRSRLPELLVIADLPATVRRRAETFVADAGGSLPPPPPVI